MRLFNLLAWLLIAGMTIGDGGGSSSQPLGMVRAEQPLAVAGQPLRGQTYVALGDSISLGYFALSADEAFPLRVATELGMDLELLARSGAKAAWGLSQLPTVQAAEPALVTVELGTNDVGFNTPPEEFAQQYETILQAIAIPGTRVLCVGSWLPAPPVDALIRLICERYGGTFVSLDGYYDVAVFHAPQGAATFRGRADWFHPGDSGHAAIASAILDSLQGHSPQRPILPPPEPLEGDGMLSLFKTGALKQ